MKRHRHDRSAYRVSRLSIRRDGFTLIELLIVVAIIAILAAIAVPNFLEARERAARAADASNLHVIGIALQSYHVDYGRLPLADRVAGPFPSHTEEFVAIGNGPAAGGSWDGVPWLLHELKYVTKWETLFCPVYLDLYRGQRTLGGDHERYHNFRYAYNTSAASSGGTAGGVGNIEDGAVWIVRSLWLGPQNGFYAARYPRYPADFAFPFGPEKNWEHAMYADMSIRLVQGGANQPPEP